MRGSETWESRLGSNGTDGFLIPMRGSETTSSPARRTPSRTFLIPMRGSESWMRLASADSQLFLIPMRGSEVHVLTDENRLTPRS